MKRRPKVRQIPKWLDKFNQFDDVDRFFQKLIHGNIETQQGLPVMTSAKGNIYDVCSAMDGWIEYWQALSEKHNIKYDGKSLVTLNNKLRNGMTLSYQNVKDAILVVDKQKTMFDILPRDAISSQATTTQIKLLIEDMPK